MSDLAPPLPRLPQRPAQGHKGTFGTVVVVGGCHAGGRAMIGAAALAALGALRSGAGLAKLVMPADLLAAGLTICPSATGAGLPQVEGGGLDAEAAPQVLDRMLGDATVAVIGPGLGEGDVERALSLRAVQQDSVPVVVDADAINNLATLPDLFRDFHAPAVVTPHPGEFRRLAAGLRIALDPTDPAQRPDGAAELSRRLGCICVLKGAGTVVSDGLRTWTCSRGHPCLATAGTGDVLSGVIAGLAAQFACGASPAISLFDAARIGVEAHAIAGERWANVHGAQAGLLAQELAEQVPGAVEGLRTPA
ncbi:MAG: NAD(P)H-hydrate dehydratase [Phycisphaerales bacterium]|nr:NAD(P)H-hydrate dehydratase [Phycisphaerales bacterium]